MLELIELGPTHKDCWERLCTLASTPSARRDPSWIPLIDQLLDERWPSHVRTWPISWLTKSQPHPATALVRTLQIFDITPKQHAKLIAQLAQLDQDSMPPLQVLDVSNRGASRRAPFNHHDAAVLWRAMSFTPLRQLYLEDRFELAPLLDALPQQPALRSLEQLELKHPRAGLINALFPRSDLGQLRTLLLTDLDGLDEAATSALAQSLSAHIERLELRVWSSHRRPISSNAWEALWSKPWPMLKQLELNLGLPLDPLHSLLSCAPSLKSLKLGSTSLSVERTPKHALEHLCLASVASSDDSLATLLSESFTSLKSLTLCHGTSPLGLATAKAITGLTQLGSLSIELREDQTSPWQAWRGRAMLALKTLNFTSSTLNSTALFEGLATMHMPALELLNLELVVLDAPQAQALVSLKLPDGCVLRYGPSYLHTYHATAQRIDALLGRTSS